MPWRVLHDEGRIGAFLARDPRLHLYEIGDLDEPFWSHSTWYALGRGDEVRALALLYTGLPLPTLLCFGHEGRLEAERELLANVRHVLPRRFYAHLSPGLADVLAEEYTVEPRGRLDKMTLEDRDALDAIDCTGCRLLDRTHLAEVDALYRAAYPDSWFHPTILDTGQYAGYFEDGELLSVAGVHVFAPEHGVAALGNIATHPSHRRRGLAVRVTARVCKALFQAVDHIGLNVHTANTAAIACYRRLGFQHVASYEEHMVTATTIDAP